MQSIPIKNPLSELEIAIEAITEATEAVNSIYEQDFKVSKKQGNEPLTEADLESNKIIISKLESSGHPILSEESLDKIENRIGKKKVWIVDPLDGTSDFVKKTGEFTIMIGLVENGIPTLGIISRPVTNSIYISQKGSGAFGTSKGKDWQKLQVSDVSDLKECRVVGSRFHRSEKENRFFSELNLAKFDSRGSSLKVVDICLANADLYYTFTDKIKQWDTCASNCLVTEAGGKMTDMEGTQLQYNTKTVKHENGILVSNGVLHEKILKAYLTFLKNN